MNAHLPNGTASHAVDVDAGLDDLPLYVAAEHVYSQRVHGFYRRVKWTLLVLTLGVYYLLPFARWDRGPSEPSQAVMVDLARRRFYFFFIEIWPQEVYYLTGLLIIAAFTLFLMNAVAGRVWCGYLCPQTVWTDLFTFAERLIEGDRRERIAKDQGPWTFQKVREKALKHTVWLLIAWWTGGVWVLYFEDAPTLVRKLATFTAEPVAYLWIGILTFTTYVLAGHMREQVCLYMCPWPRIQAALTDENALNVTYRSDRGEPRMSLKKAEAARQHGAAAGDCVDCGQCVAACPTGVDIREGASLGCIQCGLCIDACDAVMKRIHRPERLIAYDTDVNIKRRRAGEQPIYRLIRARTALYACLIAFVGLTMLYALVTRSDFGVAAIHDRNPLYTRLADGAVHNAYELRVANKKPSDRRFVLTIEGVPAARFEVVGAGAGDEADMLLVGPDQTREVRVLVSVSAPLEGSSTPIVFRVADSQTGKSAWTRDFFDSPPQ